MSKEVEQTREIPMNLDVLRINTARPQDEGLCEAFNIEVYVEKGHLGHNSFCGGGVSHGCKSRPMICTCCLGWNAEMRPRFN